MDPVHKVFRQALQSGATIENVQKLIEEKPELIAACGAFWRDGFQAHCVPIPVARFLMERGAEVSVHAAAGFGFVDVLDSMLQRDPGLVHAKGGDGCTPLHFARDIATAQLLLDRGADIDARDDDHNSTPAQWRIEKAPGVSRYLLDRGASPDIFLAAALGDMAIAAKLIAQNPNCTAHRIGRLTDFPPIGFKGRGGTILQWTLAFNSYPHQIALQKGHPGVFDFLYEKSNAQTRLLVCCVLARRDEAFAIAAKHPEIVANLPAADLELLPCYCWETNTSLDAVRLMLDLGFPVAHTEHSHGYSPLHNAAWSGNLELVDLLISRGHPVHIKDPRFNATPLGYALHDCLVEKRHPEGNFPGVIESLLKAGSPWDSAIYPTGESRLDEIFARYAK